MITNFEIRNFRCFQRLKIEGLKRYTFLVGGNGTGKTAFIEGVFLTGGTNAEIYFRVRRWRGLGEGQIELTGSRDSYEELFRDMFYNLDQKSQIVMREIDSDRGQRTLTILYDEGEAYALSSKGKSENPFLIKPITFKWETPEKGISRSVVEIKEGQIRMTGHADPYPMVMVSPQISSARQNALKFSEMSKQNKAEPVKNAIKAIFHEVEDLTLESIAGELALHVSLEGMNNKLPIANLSAGMNKYLSILLSIVSNPGGAVLVDEIESGFYYQHLPILLKSIVELCEQYKVQLIASTHSYEFLKVLGETIASKEERVKDFVLLRFERVSGKLQPEVNVVEGESYKSAVLADYEVR